MSNTYFIGRTLILSASQILLLFRGVKGDNLTSGNRFKKNCGVIVSSRAIRSDIMIMLVYNTWETIVKRIREGSSGELYSI